MSEPFLPDELLFRSAKPNLEIYWRPDGTPTSAIFKDSLGASVDRANGRPPDVAADFLFAHKQGSILYVTVKACWDCNALLVHCPEDNNPWHSQIQRSETQMALTNSQAKYLAKNAVVYRRLTTLKSDMQ